MSGAVATFNTVLLLSDGATVGSGAFGMTVGALAIVTGVVIEGRWDSTEAHDAARGVMVMGGVDILVGFMAYTQGHRRVAVEPHAFSIDGRRQPGLLLRMRF